MKSGYSRPGLAELADVGVRGVDLARSRSRRGAGARGRSRTSRARPRRRTGASAGSPATCRRRCRRCERRSRIVTRSLDGPVGGGWARSRSAPRAAARRSAAQRTPSKRVEVDRLPVARARLAAIAQHLAVVARPVQRAVAVIPAERDAPPGCSATRRSPGSRSTAGRRPAAAWRRRPAAIATATKTAAGRDVSDRSSRSPQSSVPTRTVKTAPPERRMARARARRPGRRRRSSARSRRRAAGARAAAPGRRGRRRASSRPPPAIRTMRTHGSTPR